MDFDEAFERLIAHEGGYVNDPRDPGGETNWGISKRSYPNLDIKALTREQAKSIYKRDYWDRAGANQYDPELGFAVFDAAVNSGIGNAVRFLQRAVGVADDGRIGPITVAAVKSRSTAKVLLGFYGERLEFMTKLSVWDRFGKGWARRIADNLRFAARE